MLLKIVLCERVSFGSLYREKKNCSHEHIDDIRYLQVKFSFFVVV